MDTAPRSITRIGLSSAASDLLNAKSVGVALGPGYPIGLVDLGLLIALEQFEIPISMVSGTSMGALIGALYAMGTPPLQIRKWVIENLSDDTANRLVLGDVKLPRLGVSRADDLIDYLIQLTGSDPEFHELMVPLFIVAADKVSQRAVIFRHGRVFEAVAASLSMPVIMTTRRLGEMKLADGAIFSPVQTEVLYAEGAEVVIGIQGKPIRSAKRRSMPMRTRFHPHLLRMLGWATRPEVFFAKPQCDILLRPRVPRSLVSNPIKAREIIDLGREIGYEAIAGIERGDAPIGSGQRRTKGPSQSVGRSATESDTARSISSLVASLEDYDTRTAGMSDGELMEEFPKFAETLGTALEELSKGQPDSTAASKVLRSTFEDLTALVNESPFMKRAFEKPRGYAGDYGMMDFIYQDEVLEAPSNMGKLLNYALLSSPTTHAVRNRAKIIQGVIFERVPTKETLRVASIACGAAREVSRMRGLLGKVDGNSKIIWTLLDQDEEALAQARRTIPPEGVIEPRFVAAGIRELIKREVELGEQDIVYSLGLFDYLEEKVAGRLVSRLYELLAPGGLMLIGNFHPRNPLRALMEGAVDWFLIHRSEEELLAIGKEGAPDGRHFVMAEPQGVNLILVTSKPPSPAT